MHPAGTPTKLAARVTHELAKREITRSSLASQLGRPLSTIHRKCNGTTPWTVAELVELSELLDMPPSALLDGIGPVTTREESRRAPRGDAR